MLVSPLCQYDPADCGVDSKPIAISDAAAAAGAGSDGDMTRLLSLQPSWRHTSIAERLSSSFISVGPTSAPVGASIGKCTAHEVR